MESRWDCPTRHPRGLPLPRRTLSWRNENSILQNLKTYIPLIPETFSMVEYRLTVVKLSEQGPHRGYQISHYHKGSPWVVPTMDEVIVHMAKLYQHIPSALKPEPTLVGLDTSDAERVRNTREQLLKDGLELRV